MNNNSLGILLKAVIDQDTKPIEEQIKTLSSNIKSKIELKLKIDASDLEIITKNFDEARKKIKDKEKTPLKFGSLEETSQDMKKVMSDLERIQEHFNKLGQNVQVKQVFSGADESLKKFEVSVDSLNGKLKETQKFSVNAQTDKTGNTTYGYSKITMDSKQVTEAKTKETQATNEKAQAVKKEANEVDNLILKYKSATISATEFMNAGRKLNENDNLPLKEKAKLIQALTSAEKNYASTLNQESKTNTAISDRNKALEQQRLKEEQLNKSIQERIKLYQQSFAIQTDKLTGKYGSLVDSNALNNLQGKVSGLNVKDYDSNKLKEYNLELQRIQTNAINSGKALKLGQQDAISFGAELVRSAKKFSEWYLLAGGVTGVINAIKNGIGYIFELDNALNEIRIVTGQTVEQVNSLGLSYNKLAKEMGVTTKEIVNTSVDLYRQGLDQSQVEDRMKSIIQYAKISSISLEDSNKIITATANATGESVTKIIDIFALLGRFCPSI